MKSLQRLLAITRKEVRQLRRDRLTFGMIVGIPALQLVLFGYAINMDVRHLSAGVADLSQTAASRQVVMDMAQTQVIDIQYQAADAFELESLMRQGKIVAGIYIPPDFERRLLQGRDHVDVARACHRTQPLCQRRDIRVFALDKRRIVSGRIDAGLLDLARVDQLLRRDDGKDDGRTRLAGQFADLFRRPGHDLDVVDLAVIEATEAVMHAPDPCGEHRR